jgi:hypothetical protein
MVEGKGKAFLCRPEIMLRAFAQDNEDLGAEVLAMHGLRAVWMPAIKQYRIELIKAAPVPKKHIRRPRATCPRCTQVIRYTPITESGARILDHHVFNGSRCPASLRDLDEARADVNGKGRAS